ncbi:MAG TPA: carbohydrate ABC transporter permease [Actinospica sp.]|nr:carbohydrate ABC transporter permease [Actinospica sp.]
MTALTTSRPVTTAPTATARRRSMRRRLSRRVSLLLTAIVALVFSAPVLYLVIGSLKPSNQVLDGMSGLKPSGLSLRNYSGVINQFDSGATGHFSNFYLTSLTVSGAVVIGGLIVNSVAGYALARLRWRGRKLMLLAVIALVILPFQAIAVPLFYLLDGARDTVYVQFLPFIASAFSIFLFYSFFVGLPKEFEEAAAIDGAGPWRTMLTIVMPNSKPVFASVAILSFLTSWSSFLWPVMMVDQPGVSPLPLQIAVFQGQTPVNWGEVCAFGVLMVAPVVLVFIAFQRWFVQGVTASAVKG